MREFAARRLSPTMGAGDLKNDTDQHSTRTDRHSGAWLHAIVRIKDPAPGQAVNVGMAALAAHPSLKRVTVVDSDIDIYDSEAVEWALATRVQPDRDIQVIHTARGSTLDPSRELGQETTAKWIIDATIPPGQDKGPFLRAE